VTEILQWVLIGLSIPLFVAMVIYTVRRGRELDRRIEEYHEEQEAAKNQPGPVNPYGQMAGLFGGQGPGAGAQGRTESGEQRAEGRDPRPTTHDPGPETDPRPTTHDPRPGDEEPSQ
jgi:hypothetical protein